MHKQKRPRFKLKLELVPQKLWGVNLRSKLGKNRWSKVRSKVEPKRCTICGGTERLHGHEVWEYVDRTSVAKLIRVELVCEKCHHVKHWGQSLQVVSHAGYLALRKHFRTVNNCRQNEFDRHIDRSLAVWRSRSAKEWRVDWGDFGPMIAEAFAAGGARAAQNPAHDDDPGMIGPGHHMPTKCPKCGARNTLRPIEQDTDDMSEGQLADFEAGTWGVAVCRACRHEIEWGF